MGMTVPVSWVAIFSSSSWKVSNLFIFSLQHNQETRFTEKIRYLFLLDVWFPHIKKKMSDKEFWHEYGNQDKTL